MEDKEEPKEVLEGQKMILKEVEKKKMLEEKRKSYKHNTYIKAHKKKWKASTRKREKANETFRKLWKTITRKKLKRKKGEKVRRLFTN